MWHPRISLVAVVLDEEEPSAMFQVTAHEGEHRRLVLDEVQRVGHDDAVEIGKIEPPREVSCAGAQRGLRHRGDESAPELRERGAVAIDRVDHPMRADEIGQCERERTGTGAEIRPGAAFALRYTARQHGDVIGVIHPSSLSRQPSVESARVTGPSASRRTTIAAPNRPWRTSTSAPRSAPQNPSKSRFPRSGGAAAVKSGRRPWRASPYSVNCGTARTAPPTSASARCILPPSSKMRSAAIFAARRSPSSGRSFAPTPRRTTTPDLISATRSLPTSTVAERTR